MLNAIINQLVNAAALLRAGFALAIVAATLWSLPALAVEPGRRVALVVGIGEYKSAPSLKNTIADANGVSAALKRLGFEVELETDPGRAQLEGALRRFGAKARGAEASLFFYAGHAVEIAGKNWLIPADAKMETHREVRFEAVDVEAVLEQAQAARVALLFLDACRNNPFADRMASETRSSPTRGLARVDPVTGVFVAFATAPGQVALDGTGENSPFTTALLKHMEQPGLEIRQMMSRVRSDVRRATRDQAPWEQSALEGEFYFKAPEPKVAAPVPPPAPQFNLDALFWDSIRNSARKEDFAAYLDRFPNGAFAVLAKGRLETLSATVAAAPPAAPVPPQPVAIETKPAVEPAKPVIAAPGPVVEAPAPVAEAPKPAQPAPSRVEPPAQVAALAPEAERAARPREERESDPVIAALRVKGVELSPATLALYRAAGGPKALALTKDNANYWRSSQTATDLEAQETALEACQFVYGMECRLVMAGADVSDDLSLRSMPRVLYRATYQPGNVPFVSQAMRAGDSLSNYAAQASPKAFAVHPTGAFGWKSGGDEASTQAQALASCNEAAKSSEPCYLYAIGDDIVLERRAKEAVAAVATPDPKPAAPVAAPVAPKPAPAARPNARRPAAQEPVRRARPEPTRAAPRPAPKPRIERAQPAQKQRCFTAGGLTYCS